MFMTRTIASGLTVLASLLVLAAPIVAEAQPAGKVWRIGYLTPSDIPMDTLIAAFRELGYVEGKNARFEIRTARTISTGCRSWPPNSSALRSTSSSR